MIDHNEAQDIDRLRRQAKHRFMGATVLLLLAVIALPFVLDSQPRPVPSTIAIDIPKIDAPKLEASKPEPAKVEAVAPATQSSEPTPAAPAPLVFAPAAPASAPVVAAPQAANDGARAQALLEGAQAAPKGSVLKTGFIVQAGVFSDPAMLKAATAKLDKAGLVYFTRSSELKSGATRTRIRLGPYATKEEAFEVQARVVKAGLQSIILKP